MGNPESGKNPQQLTPEQAAQIIQAINTVNQAARDAQMAVTAVNTVLTKITGQIPTQADASAQPMQADASAQPMQADASAQPNAMQQNPIGQAIQHVEAVRMRIKTIPPDQVNVQMLENIQSQLRAATQKLQTTVHNEYIGTPQKPWRVIVRHRIGLGLTAMVLVATATIGLVKGCTDQSNVQPQRRVEQPAGDGQGVGNEWWRRNPMEPHNQMPELRRISLDEHDFAQGPYGLPLQVAEIPYGAQRIIVEKIIDKNNPHEGMNVITLQVSTSDRSIANEIPEQISIVSNMHGRIAEIHNNNPDFGTYVVLENQGGFRIYIGLDNVGGGIQDGQIIYAGQPIGSIQAKKTEKGVEYSVRILYYKDFNPEEGLVRGKYQDITEKENLEKYQIALPVDWQYHAKNPPRG